MKVAIIQAIDRKVALDDIAMSKGIEFEELLDEIEAIVYSGTKLNIDYFLEDIMDEDHLLDIYDYFKESTLIRLTMLWMNWVMTLRKKKYVWYASSSFRKWQTNSGAIKGILKPANLLWLVGFYFFCSILLAKKTPILFFPNQIKAVYLHAINFKRIALCHLLLIRL